MRSKSDPISMLKDRMLGSNMASVEEFKVSAHNALLHHVSWIGAKTGRGDGGKRKQNPCVRRQLN